jgi:hypothetical protein
MKPGVTPRDGRTVVAEPTWEWVLVWTGFPLLGAAAGWLLVLVAGWVESLRWEPLFRGPLKVVASVPEPIATIGALVIGGLGGLALAYAGARERLTVTVADDRVGMERAGVTQGFDRAVISAVFRDGKRLVLLGLAAEELARESSDLDADRLEDAFVTHGYPWRADGDPHEGEYRRWVEGDPELFAGAHALFTARARALAKGDSDDVSQLRAELAKLDLVVRDEKKRQYWRPTKRFRH